MLDQANNPNYEVEDDDYCLSEAKFDHSTIEEITEWLGLTDDDLCEINELYFQVPHVNISDMPPDMYFNLLCDYYRDQIIKKWRGEQ